MLKDFRQEKFDVIIQAGQSNSEGTGYGEAEIPYVPSADVWYLNADYTISVAAAFVETDGLLSNAQKFGGTDNIHFCRDALNLLGRRYFAAFASLVKN